MPKTINPIKKAKVKEALLKGKSKKQAVIDAGYSLNTAINAWRLGVVKVCEEEIEKDFKAHNVTVEQVLKEIELGKELCLKLRDMPTYKALIELKGKHLAMFTDKTEVSGHITHSKEEEIEYNRIKGSVLN